MATSTYVIFRLHGALYGIAAGAVAEIISLPALVPIAETPSYIAGVLNVRGSVVPVLDLDRRLGRAPHVPAIGDSVILFSFDGHRFGAIVDEVLDLREIPGDAREGVPEYGREIEEGAVRYISEVAPMEEGIVALIDLERLLRSSDAIGELEGVPVGELEVTSAGPVAAGFAPDSSAEAQATFQARAEALRVEVSAGESGRQLGFAVFRLGGEHFALDVGAVRELTVIGDVTPIPCTPEKIVGQINLRGDIVTLVDVRVVLGLPAGPAAAEARGIVTTIDGSAAMLADEVDDVIHVAAGDVRPAPSASDTASKAYVTGILRHAGRTIGILDLARMFRAGEFDVDEEVV